MDLPSLHALLKVNGYHPDSSPEEIKGVLMKCGYLEDEIPAAMAILRGEQPAAVTYVPQAVAGAYVAPMIEHTKAGIHLDYPPSVFTGRIGVRQFWFGAVALCVLSLALLLGIEAIALPAYAILGGLSLSALPDLVTAPLSTIILLGIGAFLLVTPLAAFLILAAGLQIRRFHDLSLSASVWVSMLAAHLVVGFLVIQSIPSYPLAALVPVGVLLLDVLILSWPARKEQENLYGFPLTYPSLWAILVGSVQETGNARLFYARFVLPILYVQIFGIAFAFFVHSVMPLLVMPEFTVPKGEDLDALEVRAME